MVDQDAMRRSISLCCLCATLFMFALLLASYHESLSLGDATLLRRDGVVSTAEAAERLHKAQLEAEDREIREQESLAGHGCQSKRLSNPGMIHGMKMQFIHLPKTGGSSVQIQLDEWVSDNPRISIAILNSNEVHSSSFKCPNHAMQHTLFVGHRGWGFCEDVEHNAKGLFTVTAVRGAVSRMVSLYDYNLLKRATSKAQQLFGRVEDATRYTLRDLIKAYNATKDVVEPGEAILRYSGSQQCRYMCGYECLGPNAKQNATITEEYMLERALYNLRRTDCVAVTDHLDDLADQLKFHVRWIPQRFLGWQKQNTLPHSMKSVLDDEATEILARWGWADEVLYQEALKISEEKTTQAQRCLAKMNG